MKISKIPYLKDFEVYALWKYLNGGLTGRAIFQIADLTAPEASALLVISFLMRCFSDLGIALEKPTFDKESYLKWQNQEYETFRTDFKLKKFPAGKSIQKILEGDFNVGEIKGCMFILKRYGLTEYIGFGKKLHPTNQEKIKSFLDSYMDSFINDELFASDTNFFPFDKQKTLLNQDLQEHREKFGDSFILRHTPTGNELTPEESDPYLFIHTIIALERLGSIRVGRVWTEDDAPPDEQSNDYKIELEWVSLEKKGGRPNAIAPEVVAENEIGYFKFNKHSNKIKIGRTGAKNYKLLKCMLDPFGTIRTTDSVFERMATPKNMLDPAVLDPHTRADRKLEYIRFAVKELQGIKGLTGRITLKRHAGERISLQLM